MQSPKTTNDTESKSSIQRLEELHPYQLIMYLFLVGSSIIFLFLTVAHFATQPPLEQFEHFSLPSIFTFSALMMLATSYLLNPTITYFEKEEFSKLRNRLGLTLFMGVLFCICQYLGWINMVNKGVLFEGRTAGVYLYILSGLHFVHIIGGVIYLFFIFLQIVKASKDPINQLIVSTNPYEKLKLKLLRSYWYYLDVTWLFIYFYFLIRY